jgi:hypothetical protein
MKMKPEYAQKLLEGGYVFDSKYHSCRDDLLVVEYTDDYYPYRTSYYGTRLKDGAFILDNEGYVVFTSAKPVIDESTRFTLRG